MSNDTRKLTLSLRVFLLRGRPPETKSCNFLLK